MADCAERYELTVDLFWVRHGCFVFFQAEDGIRDLTVTGVQTCALPIFCVGPSTQAFVAPLGVRVPVGRVPGLLAVTSPPAQPLRRVVHAPGIHLRPDAGGGLLLGAEDVDAPAAEARSPSRLGELAALLLERAAHGVPAARGVKGVDRRVGVRPMPPDRRTIAGRRPGSDTSWDGPTP